VIDRGTGALALIGGRLEPGLTRRRLLSSPLGREAARVDMGNGWMTVGLGTHQLGGRAFLVSASFEGQRLDGYTLCDADPRLDAEWDEKTERARRAAHDKWLEAALGAGGERKPELTYALPWGEAWSSYDPRGGGTTIGVRFRRG